MRRDAPLDGVDGGARGRQRAHHEPAIVVIAAAIQQLELAAFERFEREVIELGLGRDLQLLAARQDRNLARATRLTLKHAIAGTQLIRLAEQQSREELEVETHLAHPFLRNGRVEIDAHDGWNRRRARARTE